MSPVLAQGALVPALLLSLLTGCRAPADEAAPASLIVAPVEYSTRGGDYGNERATFDRRTRSHPPAQLPLLVPGLDFSASDTLPFSVAVPEETAHVPARVVLTGTDSGGTEAGAFDAERIVVTYHPSVPSLIGEESATTEIYWRGALPDGAGRAPAHGLPAREPLAAARPGRPAPVATAPRRPADPPRTSRRRR
jgi:hypothetical protein